ncbi:39S ribosomal protein L54, mitochondrial [Ictalurus punctatus]|uniref:Large ribosomal subunit protein mL54 n=1 Tax=Ictalurus punctatus TaxID=7998 RepID=A0A2D0RU70_ICTPU|nr:39S ribosomal protein L54, mitochondrial [Ictalurus punctatus]
MALSNVLKRLTGVNLHLFSSHARLGVCALVSKSVQIRGYAKKAAAKGKGKGMVKDVLKGPEVCKDPVRLTSHAVGVNIYKQGEDPPLKPQEEYPAWLFELDLGPPKKLQELDTESYEYWKQLRKEHIWRFNKLHKGKKI